MKKNEKVKDWNLEIASRQQSVSEKNFNQNSSENSVFLFFRSWYSALELLLYVCPNTEYISYFVSCMKYSSMNRKTRIAHS